MIRTVALGGALGSLLRYAVSLAWTGHFPWSTLIVNIMGSAALGALIGWIAVRPGAHPLLRPFLGTGVLGGFTTFSTYTVEARHLFASGSRVAAMVYVLVTITGAVAAAALAESGVRRWLSSA